MKKILYLKYGELTLKRKNRSDFSNLAFDNLKTALKTFNLSFKKNFDNVIIENFNDNNIDEIISIIKFIPGFSCLSIAYKIKKNIEILTNTIIELLENVKDNSTFKVITKRKDKSFPHHSDEINRLVAHDILSKYKNFKVDLHNPKIKINVEVNDQIYIYFEKISCINGLPIGIDGKVLMLLSGGIDSPVASHLLMKRGIKVDFLTFIAPPHTSSQALEKVYSLSKQLTLNGKLQKYRVFVCDVSKIQDEIRHINKENYRITLLRRSFFRIATKIAKEYNYDAIATGESLGQVASQTINSMRVISEATNILVLRPLLTYNKNEIIDIAKLIETYNISILPFADSCSLFAPKNPITKPKLDVVLELEQKLDLLDSIELLVYNNTIREIKNDN